MFFSFRISSTRFSHSFMGQALFPVLRNRYYIVRRIDDIVILVSTPGRPSKAHETYAVMPMITMIIDDDDDDDDGDNDDDVIIMCVNE